MDLVTGEDGTRSGSLESLLLVVDPKIRILLHVPSALLRVFHPREASLRDKKQRVSTKDNIFFSLWNFVPLVVNVLF